MERVLKQNEDARELVEKILYWVSHVVRPLTQDELQHALAVQTSTSNIDQGDMYKKETLTFVCKGLIKFEPESKTIRFAHLLTEGYFRRVRGMKPPPVTNIASTCLTYLLFDVFAVGSTLDPAEWF